jgi:hypothetical protein
LTPEIQDNRNPSQTVFGGTRTFAFPVILTESGYITIPEIDISWFNPRQRQYITRTLDQKSINVAHGDMPISLIPGGQQAIRLLGRDIDFIIANPSMVNFRFHHHSVLYWSVLALLLSSLIAHYLYIIQNQKLTSDMIYSRNKRAGAIIRKYLRDANKYASKNSIEFYNYTYIGLTHFLTDKLNLPRGSVEKLIFDALAQRATNEKLINDVKSGLEKLNFAKFSNASVESLPIKDDIELINELINNLLTEFSRKNVLKR